MHASSKRKFNVLANTPLLSVNFLLCIIQIFAILGFLLCSYIVEIYLLQTGFQDTYIR
jgi:hypothetical protein